MKRNSLWALCYCLASRIAAADPCSIGIDANDKMQFSAHTLTVSPTCTAIRVTLRNIGEQPAAIMGHNWVLTLASDAAAVSSAGRGAGLAGNYLPAGDRRIIVATPMLGAGESATVRFETARLTPGASYKYFCSAPGHFAAMNGKLSVSAAGTVTAANRAP